MPEPTASPKTGNPKLSICLATHNRGTFIADTLDSILGQLTPEMEVVVVDGASQDDTGEVMGRYAADCDQIRYFRESVNSGVDADYDKAVGYSTGDYCWLFTDDDLLKPGALSRVWPFLDGTRDLVVVNSEIRNADLSKVLSSRALSFAGDRDYGIGEAGLLFSEAGDYLSFIGGFIVRRAFWVARERAAYYGTLFVHAAVAFQAPAVERARVMADPLITIRYGNAMWSSRGFEIWMFKWPRLVWSFSEFSTLEKSSVCRPEPWKQAGMLIYYRAIGAYSLEEYRHFFPLRTPMLARALAFAIALAPGRWSNWVASVYCVLLRRKALVSIYDLSRSPYSSWISRLAIRHLHASA